MNDDKYISLHQFSISAITSYYNLSGSELLFGISDLLIRSLCILGKILCSESHKGKVKLLATVGCVSRLTEVLAEFNSLQLWSCVPVS